MSDGREIIFIVEDDPEGGLTARALGVSIFTEAESMPELKESVLDALRCHYDDEADIPRIIRLHRVQDEILTYT
jgi:hypothetical protein